MTETHLHVLITHLPIFGSILGALVLTYGLLTKSDHTKIAAYGLLIISSIGAGISYLTGEGAEETAEKIQGVAKEMIDQHEGFAVFALTALIISGAVSFFGLFMTLRKSSLTKSVALITLFISLTGFVLVARTGYLGGQIRHTEINANPVLQDQSGKNEEKD